jgi:hypothetical protein
MNLSLSTPSLYQYQDVSVALMERLMLGAGLAKATNLPILITGLAQIV